MTAIEHAEAPARIREFTRGLVIHGVRRSSRGRWFVRHGDGQVTMFAAVDGELRARATLAFSSWSKT